MSNRHTSPEETTQPHRNGRTSNGTGNGTHSDSTAPTGPHPRTTQPSPTNLNNAMADSVTRVFNGDSLNDRIALLVIDMQESFRTMAEPLLPKLLPLIQLCQSPEHCETSLVIFTQHGHSMQATEEDDGELGRFWGRENLIRIGTPEWELLPELKPLAKRVLPKMHYDAFFDTNLHEILSFAGVTTVIICGVLTNLCCETTARSAFVHDYSVWFLSDGTGSRTNTMQKASLLNLEYGFAQVMTCQQAMQRVQEREIRVLNETPHHFKHEPFDSLPKHQHPHAQTYPQPSPALTQQSHEEDKEDRRDLTADTKHLAYPDG